MVGQFKKPRSLLVFGALIIIDVLLLSLTNPLKLPLVGLVLPFVLIFLTLYSGWFYLLRLLIRRFSTQRVIGLALLLSTMPTLLAVFESVHQLSIKDVLLAMAIVVAMGFYLLRVDFL